MLDDGERARLNRLCAERFGFVPTEYEREGSGCWYLRAPDGTGKEDSPFWHSSGHNCWMDSPDFTRDMNAWLKWGLAWVSEWLDKANLGQHDDCHATWTIGQGWQQEVRVSLEPLWAVRFVENYTFSGPLSDLPLLLCRLVERLGD